MSTGWQTVLLGDVCTIEIGRTPARKNPRLWDPEKSGDNVWLSIADLSRNGGRYIADSKEYVSDDGAKSCKLVEAGTLLASFKLTLGRLAFAERDLFTNEAIAALSVRNEEFLSRTFLYWYLTYFDWDKAAEGDEKVKGKTLNKAKLAVLPVVVPPLLEQERIVAILDETIAGIDSAVRNAEKNLANGRQVFESFSATVFADPYRDWERRPLGEICQFFNGKAHERCIDEGGSHIVVNSKFISSDGTSFKRTNTPLFPLKKGDVVMVMSDVPKGKALAKCALIETSDTHSLNQRICVIRSEQLDHRFLYYHLNRHPYLLAHDNEENQTNLRKGDILACPLFVPPKEEQEFTIRALDEFGAASRELENVCRKKLDALLSLRQSVLHKAFTGELTAQPEQALREATA